MSVHAYLFIPVESRIIKWPREDCRSNSICLSRTDYKRHCSFLLGLFCSLWDKPVALVMKTPEHSPHEETNLCSFESRTCWKWLCQIQTSLQMTTALINLRLDWDTDSFLNSWPAWTVRDNKYYNLNHEVWDDFLGSNVN